MIMCSHAIIKRS